MRRLIVTALTLICVSRITPPGVRNRFVHDTDKGHMGIVDDVIKEARAFIAEIEQPK